MVNGALEHTDDTLFTIAQYVFNFSMEVLSVQHPDPPCRDPTVLDRRASPVEKKKSTGAPEDELVPNTAGTHVTSPVTSPVTSLIIKVRCSNSHFENVRWHCCRFRNLQFKLSLELRKYAASNPHRGSTRELVHCTHAHCAQRGCERSRK